MQHLVAPAEIKLDWNKCSSVQICSHASHVIPSSSKTKHNWTCFVGFKTSNPTPFKKLSRFLAHFTTGYHKYTHTNGHTHFFPSSGFNCWAKNSTLTPFTIAFDESFTQFKAEGCSHMAELNVQSWGDTPRPTSVSSTVTWEMWGTQIDWAPFPNVVKFNKHTPNTVCKNMGRFFLFFFYSQSCADVKLTDSWAESQSVGPALYFLFRLLGRDKHGSTDR